jgi:hypothetical protein
MMRSMPAAARGQARIFAAGQQYRQRPQPEQQNQEDGKPTPHLKLIVHDIANHTPKSVRGSGIIGVIVFHR